MANTKISALPTFTGNTTGVYVVIDNAGLTETFKITANVIFDVAAAYKKWSIYFYSCRSQACARARMLGI